MQITKDLQYFYLKKAFDVDHSILLNKLEYCGFIGQVNNFLKSYLLDRKTISLINNTLSSERYIIYSVPRGSVVGLLFFIIFINDIYI